MIDKIGELTYKSVSAYGAKLKPMIDDLKFKEQYQGRIIDCMVGEVDDNYIETPETDNHIVKLEHSKEGVVKIPSIKGKTILVDSEGNETNTPGEGCKLVSIGEDEDNKLIILSKNKNLFTSEVIDALCNLENWVGNGAYRNNYVAYNLMNFKNGVTYTNTIPSIKIPPNFYPILYLENVGNGHFLASGLYNNNTSNEMTIPLRKWTFSPQNVGSFRAYVNSWNDENMQKLRKVLEQNIQTEVGNIGTDYIKAMCHKTEILLDEPLRKLPNGVCDEIVDNKIIRRIGSVTLDGDKVTSIGIVEDNVVDVLYFDKTVTNKKFINYGIEGQQLIKSNIYRTGINANSWNSIINEHTLVNTNSNGFWIFLPKFTVFNINDARNYMNNKPTEVLYELAEPIIEELPNSIILQGFDDTTMYIENEITPTVTYGYNALIPYKEEVLKQQQEVETNTIDIEQNIIPYLMDMEFNLMLMEDE